MEAKLHAKVIFMSFCLAHKDWKTFHPIFMYLTALAVLFFLQFLLYFHSWLYSLNNDFTIPVYGRASEESTLLLLDDECFASVSNGSKLI